mmetsp:Transcript_32495/g.71019  ORF Transcript_32495/g.71019 Transcript_32495/m.71019 type:complete len:434 (-) Transcript_32495:444-1745(-)
MGSGAGLLYRRPALLLPPRVVGLAHRHHLLVGGERVLEAQVALLVPELHPGAVVHPPHAHGQAHDPQRNRRSGNGALLAAAELDAVQLAHILHLVVMVGLVAELVRQVLDQHPQLPRAARAVSAEPHLQHDARVEHAVGVEDVRVHVDVLVGVLHRRAVGVRAGELDPLEHAVDAALRRAPVLHREVVLQAVLVPRVEVRGGRVGDGEVVRPHLRVDPAHVVAPPVVLLPRHFHRRVFAEEEGLRGVMVEGHAGRHRLQMVLDCLVRHILSVHVVLVAKPFGLLLAVLVLVNDDELLVHGEVLDCHLGRVVVVLIQPLAPHRWQVVLLPNHAVAVVLAFVEVGLDHCAVHQRQLRQRGDHVATDVFAVERHAHAAVVVVINQPVVILEAADSPVIWTEGLQEDAVTVKAGESGTRQGCLAGLGVQLGVQVPDE